MGKAVLAFVAGAVLGWLFAVMTQTPAPDSVPDAASPAERAVRDVPAPALARAPRARPPSPAGASEPAPVAGKAKEAKPGKAPAPPEKVISDAEVIALLGDADAPRRRWAMEKASSRRLVSVAQLLDRARSDPDREAQVTAFHLAVANALESDGTMEIATSEILTWARDTDPDRRAAGLQHLGETRARGAGVGRELLDAGALPGEVYESAVRTLVAAREFEGLVPDSLDDDLRERLTNVLSEALEGDPSLGSRVVAVLREAGPPSSPDSVEGYCRVALQAGAAALVADLVRSASAPPESRARALEHLVESDTHVAFGVALAEEVLTDAKTPAGLRRAFLDAAGSALAQQGGAAGLAVLRRVRDHDPNPWIRMLAADCTADAESR